MITETKDVELVPGEPKVSIWTAYKKINGRWAYYSRASVPELGRYFKEDAKHAFEKMAYDEEYEKI